MTSIESGNQPLDGPFTHHVYIGFCSKDAKIALDLRRELEKKEVSCFLRETKYGVQTSIKEGVRSSQKCLLILSQEYFQDEWFKTETATVLEKVNLFGINTLIVMKTDPVLQVPENLKGFKETVLSRDARAIDLLVTSIIAEPKMVLKYGAAAGYFHGYLRIILPGFRKRLTEETVQREWLPKTVKKMLIIVPESCFCPPSMVNPGKIEFTEKFVLYAGNRAGNIKRDYKNSLYKVIDKEKNEEYFFSGEFATPLLTLYETFKSQYCNMTIDDLSTERIIFCSTLKFILDHPDNDDCRNQYKIVYWCDPETGKQNCLDLHHFLLSVLREELTLESLPEASKIQRPSDVNARDVRSQSSQPVFEPTPDIAGSDPTSLYEGIVKYPLNSRPRGKCLIINIIKFEDDVNLTQRTGSEKDTGILEKLFKDLHFVVDIHPDLKSDTLDSLLAATGANDHSAYDAFVCCILSHGKLGEIYTSDGRPKKVLDIVDFFADRQCPTLKGKPKMFFIQACQTGDDNEQQTVSSGQRSIEPDRQTIEEGIKNLVLTECDASAEGGGARPDPQDLLPVTASATSENVRQESVSHKSVLVPSYPDFLMSYSTLPGSVSYRNTEFGSFYIHALDKCLRERNEIDRALKQVTKNVRKELEARSQIEQIDLSKQLPFHLTCAMERLIYL